MNVNLEITEFQTKKILNAGLAQTNDKNKIYLLFNTTQS